MNDIRPLSLLRTRAAARLTPVPHRLMSLLVVVAACACQPEAAHAPGSADAGAPVAATCGDARCDLGEDCETCADDCGACASTCFDGVCQLQEGCQRCPADCGVCALPPGALADEDGPDPEPGPAEPDPAPSPDPPPPPDDNWAAGWVEKEDAMLALVNAMRDSGGDCPSGYRPAVPPLVVDQALRDAARGHALDMGERAYFSHDTPDGLDPWERIDAAGYTASATGENIAAGNGTAQATFEQWRTSDGHCRNMMSASSTEIGIGYAYVDSSPYGHYWVQNFGRR